MSSGIYEVLNTATGKRYIGSAVDLSKRWRNHLHLLSRGAHYNLHLQRAWTKDGANSFSFTPLLICSPGNLLFYEQRCIDGLKPDYNKARVAGSTLGTTRSTDTRRRMSAAQKARLHAPLGPMPAATRAKISAAHRGRAKSIKHRASLSAATLGVAKKAPFSLDHRRNMSLAKRGRKHSAESRAHMAEGQRRRRSNQPDLGRAYS